jgi:hypothetical protein
VVLSAIVVAGGRTVDVLGGLVVFCLFSSLSLAIVKSAGLRVSGCRHSDMGQVLMAGGAVASLESRRKGEDPQLLGWPAETRHLTQWMSFWQIASGEETLREVRVEIFRCLGLFVGSLLLSRFLEGRVLVVSGRFLLRMLVVGMLVVGMLFVRKLFIGKLFIGKLLVGGWLVSWLFVDHVRGVKRRAIS